MLQRDPKSHKGQNGTVAVLGGSHKFHGAPIFSALAAEATGVDLVYPIVHACHGTVTRMASPGFIVQTFKENGLTKDDVKEILSLLREVHVAVLGPGMAENQNNAAALAMIVLNAPCALVLDARTLRPNILKHVRTGKPTILTPHIGELEQIVRRSLTGATRTEITALVKKLAKSADATIILKGAEDLVCSSQGRTEIIRGGNAGLTKGGTGDALAGVIAGLLAQGMDPMGACVTGTTLIKKAAEYLAKEKGFAYSTREVIEEIPKLLKLAAKMP